MSLNDPPSARADLRRRLLTERRDWIDTPAGQQASPKLQERLLAILDQLEPDCLGIYWPMPGEFNPMDIALMAQNHWESRVALPFAKKNPVTMHFRIWDGAPPTETDECGLPTGSGKPIEPDVVLVPCLGFTPEGWRLGYGGGYFDRYLAAHPQITAIGIAWEISRLSLAQLQPEPHDIPLMAVLTEGNTWSA